MRTLKTTAATAIILLAGLSLAHAQCIDSVSGGDAAGCVTLYAGQTIDAGTVCYEADADSLDVTYTTTSGWELEETHLWVGASYSDMPQTRKGNPIPGQFPYFSGDITGATSWSVSIPLAELGFACPGDDQDFFAAAHAALRRNNGDGTYQTETGWGDGSPITSRGGWATYTTVSLTCECDDPPPPDPEPACETAFAFGDTCFLDIDEDGDVAYDFNRWGWSIGPLSPGTYSHDIYAGAGQCNLTAGTLVGTLDIDYDGSTALLTLTMDAGFGLEETHAYVGNEILPRNGNGFYTVAPGQYPQIHEDLGEASSDSFTFSASGDVYVVVHGVVCGEY